MPKKELHLAPHPQAISELSLRNSIQNVENTLRGIDKDYWPDDSRKIFSTKINEILDSNGKKITWNDIRECWETAEKNERPNELKINFFYARLYALSAREIIDNSNNGSELAQTFIRRSIFHLGYLEGYQALIDEAALLLKGPLTGSKSVQSIYLNTEFHLVELLSSPPKGGWSDEMKAIEETESALEKFILDNKFGKVILDTEKFISKKLHEKGIVLDAYNLHSKKNKRRQNAKARKIPGS